MSRSSDTAGATLKVVLDSPLKYTLPVCSDGPDSSRLLQLLQQLNDVTQAENYKQNGQEGTGQLGPALQIVRSSVGRGLMRQSEADVPSPAPDSDDASQQQALSLISGFNPVFSAVKRCRCSSVLIYSNPQLVLPTLVVHLPIQCELQRIPYVVISSTTGINVQTTEFLKYGLDAVAPAFNEGHDHDATQQTGQKQYPEVQILLRSLDAEIKRLHRPMPQLPFLLPSVISQRSGLNASQQGTKGVSDQPGILNLYPTKTCNHIVPNRHKSLLRATRSDRRCSRRNLRQQRRKQLASSKFMDAT